MTVEPAFSGTVRVVTKSYGILNDSDNGSLEIVIDKLTSQENRSIVLSQTEFVTSGNATFLVGIPQAPWNGILYQQGLDNNLIEDDNWSHRIYLPIQEIIGVIAE